jgi:transposase-like protein
VTEKTRTEPNGAAPTAGSGVVDEQLVDELVARASAVGVSLTGEGGLLHQLTRRVLESPLEGEMDAHLGYGKHEAAGRDGGNSRNGRRSKPVLTEVGPVQVDVPRDRDASFSPRIVRKRQRRLDGGGAASHGDVAATSRATST